MFTTSDESCPSAFRPDFDQQSDSERRRLRQEYRGLIGSLQESEETASQPHSDKLSYYMKEGAELFKNVRASSECILDSHFVKLCAVTCRRQAESSSSNKRTFNNVEYTEKLALAVNENTVQSRETTLSAEGWLKYGKIAANCSALAPVFNFMYGRYEQDPPPVPIVQRRERTRNEKVATKELSQVTADNAQKKDTAEVMAGLVMGILERKYEENKRMALPYFKFVLDPTSFSKSIENIYYTSFLFRDGHAALYTNERHEFVIEPHDADSDSESPEPNRYQTVIELDEESWQELCELYTLKRPMIDLDIALSKRKSVE